MSTLRVDNITNEDGSGGPLAPGDDYSNEEQFVQDICSATHTPEIVQAYQDHLAEQTETP